MFRMKSCDFQDLNGAFALDIHETISQKGTETETRKVATVVALLGFRFCVTAVLFEVICNILFSVSLL